MYSDIHSCNFVDTNIFGHSFVSKFSQMSHSDSHMAKFLLNQNESLHSLAASHRVIQITSPVPFYVHHPTNSQQTTNKQPTNNQQTAQQTRKYSKHLPSAARGGLLCRFHWPQGQKTLCFACKLHLLCTKYDFQLDLTFKFHGEQIYRKAATRPKHQLLNINCAFRTTKHQL